MLHRGGFSAGLGAQRGKNEFLFGVLWCFLGIFGDNIGQNANIFLKSRKETRCGGGRLPAFHRAHWSRVAGLAVALFRCVPSFYPLFCLAPGALLANVALFRVLRGFLAGFMVRMYICMG